MSKYNVETLEDKKEWDSYNYESYYGTIFNKYDFLKIMEKYSNTKLYSLIGYKGKEPIGLFPLFHMKKGPFNLVFSPPPFLFIPHLGPILLTDKNLIRKKFESINYHFIQECFNWVKKNLNANYERYIVGPNYQDIRGFHWQKYNSQPKFTYYVDLKNNEEKLLKNFYKSLRTNIRKCLDSEYKIIKNEKDSIEFVYKIVEERYLKQKKNLKVKSDYFLDLFDKLNPKHISSYIIQKNGSRVSGFIILKYKEKIYSWFGGAKNQVDHNYQINDCLHWEIIKDARKNNFQIYDLVGANTYRLCNYKNNFSPILITYYEITKSNKIIKMVENLYDRGV